MKLFSLKRQGSYKPRSIKKLEHRWRGFAYSVNALSFCLLGTEFVLNLHLFGFEALNLIQTIAGLILCMVGVYSARTRCTKSLIFFVITSLTMSLLLGTIQVLDHLKSYYQDYDDGHMISLQPAHSSLWFSLILVTVAINIAITGVSLCAAFIGYRLRAIIIRRGSVIKSTLDSADILRLQAQQAFTDSLEVALLDDEINSDARSGGADSFQHSSSDDERDQHIAQIDTLCSKKVTHGKQNLETKDEKNHVTVIHSWFSAAPTQAPS
eukprot:GILJ01003380.1.p1 GENE.GILJ01003380.1~~GILJ01003380.1.p1  ORF type:complete len:267 (+),score=25.61 GILJ01003380.1:116-916(+)